MALPTSTLPAESSTRPATTARFRLSRFDICLLVLFLLSLPLCNPWVHGDGVGYYALGRALLIDHNLDFHPDWLQANTQFRMAHTDAQGRVPPRGYTSTGHLINHYAVGPAILWSPFLIAAHAAVLFCDHLGAHVAPDGFSRPYVVSMAFATALYGFLALWISFCLARRSIPERWSFLATVGIWFASSLPVYMYFNPSWSHAHSAFVVALFLWYWNRTRDSRTLSQWILLGLIAGLMMDVYYVSAVMLLLPLFEFLTRFRSWFPERKEELRALVLHNIVFACAALVAFLPTLITKKIIFGSYLNFGYTERWYWNSPALLKVAFSSEHGMFSWTPVLIAAVLGLFFFARRDRRLAWYSLVVFFVYLYVIGAYQDWHGVASFGNRFFVSLTPLFILGLAALFDRLAQLWKPGRAMIVATASTSILILWNFGLMYQWGVHMIPPRGPISWRQAVYNQFAIVPAKAFSSLEDYLTRRGKLMQHIEDEDIKQLKSKRPD